MFHKLNGSVPSLNTRNNFLMEEGWGKEVSRKVEGERVGSGVDEFCVMLVMQMRVVTSYKRSL